MPTPQPPEWATSPSAVVMEPNQPQKESGWIPTVPPAARAENWRARQVYLALQHIYGSGGAIYDDLAEAVTASEVGDRVLVFEDDLGTGPGVEEVEKDTGITFLDSGSNCIALTSSGVIYATEGNDPVLVNRDLDELESGGSPEVTFTRTNSGDVTQIVSDGVYVVALYNNRYVECWDIDGTQRWVKDAGGTHLSDVCLRNDFVYVVGSGLVTIGFTSGKQLHALNVGDGAEVWTYQHTSNNNALNSVACNGRQVFVGGLTSDYASAAVVRAIRASDGADATGEGGGTVDYTGLSWDVNSLSVPSGGRIDADGQRLYLGFSDGATNQVEVLAQGDGRSAWSYAHPDGTMDCASLSVDQDWLLAAYNDGGVPSQGQLHAYDKRNGRLVWQFIVTDESAGTDGSGFGCVASDGQKVYAAVRNESLVYRISRGNKGGEGFIRVDPGDFNGGIRNLALQPERAL